MLTIVRGGVRDSLMGLTLRLMGIPTEMSRRAVFEGQALLEHLAETEKVAAAAAFAVA